MLVELMPALVELIERRKECRRVGGMDHHRPFVARARFPNRIKLRVVDWHELARFIAMAEPERFVKLQTLGADAKTFFQPFDFPVTPAVVVDAVEVDQCESKKPAWVPLVER